MGSLLLCYILGESECGAYYYSMNFVLWLQNTTETASFSNKVSLKCNQQNSSVLSSIFYITFLTNTSLLSNQDINTERHEVYNEISYRVTLIFLITYTCIPTGKQGKKHVGCQCTDTGQVHLVMASKYKLNMKDWIYDLLDWLLIIIWRL